VPKVTEFGQSDYILVLDKQTVYMPLFDDDTFRGQYEEGQMWDFPIYMFDTVTFGI